MRPASLSRPSARSMPARLAADTATSRQERYWHEFVADSESDALPQEELGERCGTRSSNALTSTTGFRTSRRATAGSGALSCRCPAMLAGHRRGPWVALAEDVAGTQRLGCASRWHSSALPQAGLPRGPVTKANHLTTYQFRARLAVLHRTDYVYALARLIDELWTNVTQLECKPACHLPHMLSEWLAR
jgi:hypothetical protein